jgi:hydrogenase expression/formation protein HypD
MIALAEGDNRIICTFGDMMRVPGSDKTLLDSKIAGKDIRVLYSPVDALRWPRKTQTRKLFFLALALKRPFQS